MDLYTNLYVRFLVCKDHHRDQHSMVLIHRWKDYPWGRVRCGRYQQMVVIYRWCLYTGDL